MVAELTRQGTRHVVGVEGLLPRVLYRYELHLRRTLDLTDPDTRTQIGITTDELVAHDWTTSPTSHETGAWWTVSGCLSPRASAENAPLERS